MKGTTVESGELLAVLGASGKSPEVPEDADAYGWLVGSWDLDVRNYWGDVSGLGLRGEAHFGWVLEGRAMQDLWIMPRRPERTQPIDKARNMYGVTLRVWDPAIQAWRVTWFSSVNAARADLIGRWSGKDVVQVGTRPDGVAIRWIFSEITRESFRWTGESLQPDGRSWKLEGEFLATRARGER